jgi:hypothetical protein
MHASHRRAGSRRRNAAHIRVLAGSAFALAAAAGASPATASPNYLFEGTIGITPSTSNTAGTFAGYDLATFDSTTQLYYLTDRSNNSIDVLSAKTNTFVERIGSGLFTGNGTAVPAASGLPAVPAANVTGPNGIGISDVPGGKLLVTSNGNSTVQTFNLASNGLTVLSTPAPVSTVVTGLTPTQANRVDGVAYSPTANTIIAANNTSNPGFVTLVDNATGTIRKTLILDGTNGLPNVNGNGVEATIFNTATGTFFVAVPQFNNTGAGGAIEVDPVTGALIHTYDFNALGLSGSATCSPTGAAQGAGAAIFIACSDPSGSVQSILLNPATATSPNGSIQVVAGISGGDQAAYDPANNTFFESARFALGGPVLGVVDATTGLLTETLPITFNDHSVAVDPVSGEVFVAFGASASGNPYCATTGCIGVFAVQVPEPAALTVMGFALAVLAGCGRWLGRAARIGGRTYS